MRYDLAHLEEAFEGTIQPDEGLFLYAVIKVLRPAVILEFGFYHGYSADNFLKAMPRECVLYSFDPDPKCLDFVKLFSDRRFRFLSKKGEDFEPQDIDGRLIDVVFIDANHEFATNVKIFGRIKKSLAHDCLIVVHDTGLYNKDFMGTEWNIPGSFYVTEKGYAHRPQERLFVNYLKWAHPEYQQIHLHSMSVGRMGLTILQRYKKLDAGPGDIPILLSHYFGKFVPRAVIRKLKAIAIRKG